VLVGKVGSDLLRGWERVPGPSRTASLEVELVVQTVVGIPPFLSLDRESNTDHELLLFELPLVVL